MTLRLPTRYLLLILAIVAAGVQLALAQDAGIPSLEALEAAGAVIGDIRIVPQDIFDLGDPRENNWLFSLANRLHVQTRPVVIRRQLLFRTGERLSAQRVQETERLLRGNSYLYEVHIRPIAWRDGIVDLEVATRDTWSLAPSASFKRAGGTSSGGVSLRDYNLLGTGLRFGISERTTTEVSATGDSRKGINLELAYPYAFDGRTLIDYKQSSFTDGSSRAFTVAHPFYALDSRWAAAFSTATDDRLVTSYANGSAAGQFRARGQSADVSAGWSRGLIDDWTHRVTLGLHHLDEAYGVDPGVAAPAQLPEDRTLVSPYLRYDAIEDNFQLVSNVDQIGRPEYLALGLQSSVQIGRSARALGSTQAVTQYSGSVSRGFRFSRERTLLAATSLSGEYAAGHADRGLWSGSARYYQRRGSGSLLYLSLAADATSYADATRYLSLGGDMGLRGYPTNYQLGDRRMLLTLEQRLYSDWYLWQLIRVGGAVFYDIGRAWGGPYENQPQRHWPSDFGFGLRLLSTRSATGTTLHLDIAFPLEREPGVKASQITFLSKSGF